MALPELCADCRHIPLNHTSRLRPGHVCDVDGCKCEGYVPNTQWPAATIDEAIAEAFVTPEQP